MNSDKRYPWEHYHAISSVKFLKELDEIRLIILKDGIVDMINVLTDGKKKVKILTAKQRDPHSPAGYKTYIFDSYSNGIFNLRASKTIFNKKPQDAIIVHKGLVDGFRRNGWADCNK